MIRYRGLTQVYIVESRVNHKNLCPKKYKTFNS